MSYSTAEAKLLDKFYTRPEAADLMIRTAQDVVRALGEGISDRIILEPSAGAGAFLDALASWETKEVIALDIAPEDPRVCQGDFLAWTPESAEWDREGVLTLGNPPFGKGGKMALAFLNAAFNVSSVVALILPVTFRKWSLHKKILPEAQLVADVDLPENSFTLNGQPYKVRCCAQVWTTENIVGTGLEDVRIRQALPISHPDFECWQYNATLDARKYFDYPWDFGVLRQGYGDYDRFLSKGDKICTKKQWIFFKARSPEILERLKAIDYDALSRTNTSVRGFGKAQIVAEYIRLYGDRNA